MSITRKMSLIIIMLYFVLLGTERFNPSFIDSNNLFYKGMVFVVAYVSCLIFLFGESSDGRFKRSFLGLFWVLVGFGVVLLVMLLKFNGLKEFEKYVSNFTDGFTFYTFALTILVMIIKKEK